MIILGEAVKSRTGTGILLIMYSATTSILYLSCAEMGTMGAPSATVPAEHEDRFRRKAKTFGVPLHTFYEIQNFLMLSQRR